MSGNESTTAGGGLVLSVRDQAGREELRVQVQKMNIGSGEADTISAGGVGQAHASVVRNTTGGYRVKVNTSGSFIFDETAQSDVTELVLESGVSFRVGNVSVHCIEEAPRNMEVDEWATSCPFCSTAMASPLDTACACCGKLLRREERNQWTGWIPTTVGPYQIKGFVGRGGMGVVLRGMAEDDLLVAVKLIRSRFPNPASLRKFDDETSIIKKMPPHPNIVGYRGHGCEEERLRWLAMEWIEGKTLAERISAADGRTLAIPEIASIMDQLVRGLRHLHQHGIIHRDLKPGNIFVRPDAGVKICDFGIARGIDTGTVLSSTGNTSGTMFYTSPEQRIGGRIGTASDIYTLGLVWQEMLTGNNTGGLLNIRRQDCPQAWKEMIQEMLAVSPDQRPELAAIDAVIRTEGKATPQEKPLDELEESVVRWWGRFSQVLKSLYFWCKPRTSSLIFGLRDSIKITLNYARKIKVRKIVKSPWFPVACLAVSSVLFLRFIGMLGPSSDKPGIAVIIITYPCLFGVLVAFGQKKKGLTYTAYYILLFLAATGIVKCGFRSPRRPPPQPSPQTSTKASPIIATTAAEDRPDSAASTQKGVDKVAAVSAAHMDPSKWQKMAEAGDPFAQALWGQALCYGSMLGKGIKVDTVEGKKWIEASASTNHPLGLYWRGSLRDAEGDPRAKKDFADAVTQGLVKNAEEGGSMWWAAVGRCYSNGQGVDKDEAHAAKWYLKAAEQGDALAQNNLAAQLTYGDGVAKNEAEAAKWFRKAADQGYVEAQIHLGVAYVLGKGVIKDQTEAVNWFRKAANQGNADAQMALGVHYSTGGGIPRDVTEAVKWYRKAADQGNTGAQYTLAQCYQFGRGVTKDMTEAVKWYRKAAEQGHAGAQNNLGLCYADGVGVAKNEADAVKWYGKAAEQGDAYAQNNLGRCYFGGVGVAKNQVEAVKWFRKSAEQGHANGQCSLGRSYAYGVGVVEDRVEALMWLILAAKSGDERLIEAQKDISKKMSADQIAEARRKSEKWLEKQKDSFAE